MSQSPSDGKYYFLCFYRYQLWVKRRADTINFAEDIKVLTRLRNRWQNLPGGIQNLAQPRKILRFSKISGCFSKIWSESETFAGDRKNWMHLGNSPTAFPKSSKTATRNKKYHGPRPRSQTPLAGLTKFRQISRDLNTFRKISRCLVGFGRIWPNSK